MLGDSMEVKEKGKCNKPAGDGDSPQKDSSKKMKQTRLPFHPIEVCSQTTGQGTKKKRKLPEEETQSPKLSKQPKTKDTSEKVPSLEMDSDHEVSSSCEAENIPLAGPQVSKPTLLDKFFKKKSQEEITSTIEVVDLTAMEEEDQTQRSEVSSSKDKETKEGSSSSLQQTEGNEAMEVCEEQAEEPNTSADKEMTEIAKTESSSSAKEEEEKSAESGDDKTSEEDTMSESEADKSKLNDSSELLDTSASTVKDSSNADDTPSKRRRTDSSTPASTKKTPTSTKGTKARSKLSEEKKQEKLQRRQEIKEQKEKELQEKKEKREQEKEERRKKREEEKAAKEKAKQDAKEKKEKERLEKKEQAEKEKQEKFQQKEEEKKKKQELLEAKAEEKRKKEEEKRLKDQEKLKEEEEEARKRQKQQQVFSNFFVPKKAAAPKPLQEGTGWYMPFELRKGMHLAPARRPRLTEEEKKVLDTGLQEQVCTFLYFDLMKKGEVGKGRSSRTLPRLSLEEDVELLSHDSEVVKKVTHHVKFLKFEENNRPPYYGTWRRKSKFISPKNPFKKDKGLDYEVDSDDEWEEEEPGESLSTSEDEQDRDEEKSDDDDEEDGWMVPHGYLSEGEGCEDDEEVTPEILRARRAAKVEAWEAELRRKCQPARAQVHGCYWEEESCSFQPDSLSILQQFQAVCLRDLPISTSLRVDEAGEAGGEKSNTTPGSKGPVKKSVPEEAMPDLVRLVHGNECGIKKLVKEFRMYWKKKTCPTSSPKAGEPMEVDPPAEEKSTPVTPVMSAAESPATPGNTDPEEDGDLKDGYIMSKRQLEIRINSIAVRDRRPKLCKKMCWYVSSDVLEKYGCSDLTLPNQWQYVSVVLKKKPVTEEPASGSKTPSSVCADAEEEEPASEETTPQHSKPLPRDQRSIMDFARRLEQSELNKSMEEGSTSKEIRKDEEKDAVPSSSSAEKKKPVKPRDQPSIASFTKRAELKSVPASSTQGENDQGPALGSVEVTSSRKNEGDSKEEPILID